MTYSLINLEEHSNFNSVSEMNHNVRQFNKELSAKHYEILNLLAQYSCKVIGVSHLKIDTIANKLNKSTRTIKRYIKYLADNHFISVVNTSRIKSGGKGANIYVINSIKQRAKFKNVTSKMSHRNKGKNVGQSLATKAMAYVKIRKETMFFKAIFNNSFSNNKRKYKAYLQRIENIKAVRQCPVDVPIDLYRLNAPFFTDEQIKVMYRIAQKEAIKYSDILNDDDIETIVTDTFKAVVIALRNHYKNGADPVKNIFAYATATAKRMTNKRVSAEMWAFL